MTDRIAVPVPTPEDRPQGRTAGHPELDVALTEAAPGGGLSTFLFTDIEGSTRLWEEHAPAMGEALALHDQLLRAAVEGHGGTVIKTTGDGMLAVFARPTGAVEAAIDGQRALRDASWGQTGPLRVRMALHAGAAEMRDGDYFGPSLNRVARILAIGHGGQIICSAVAAVLTRDALAPAVDLVDLGTHRLRDIDRPEQVYQVVVNDLPSSFPPLRSLNTRRSNLPAQLTSFVGREQELGEIAELLGRHRLVTLIGTGGTGKTRLMLEAAGRLRERYADGVWLAELAPLGDPAQIPSEVARAIGAPEVTGVPTMTTVTAFLAEKELLLLLDNAEHLVDGVARLAEQMLSTAPGLRILTTSREALAVPGEAVFQLQSLTCPGDSRGGSGARGLQDLDLDAAASTEAVRLFAERAVAVDPTFALSAANVAPVARICQRLDGIPLAIELAAARVSAMSPDDIANRLGDRFRLLAGGRRTAVPRQQTLHALIDWSWDLLTDEDRRLLRRLSVFTGGWTVEIATGIVGDGPDDMDADDLVDGLSRLVDRSLIIADRDASTRYRMLETIRQYAREKLIEADEVIALSDRHLAAFAKLAIDAEGPLRGRGMIDWVDRLDSELDNLGSALEWALEADPWLAVRMVTGLLGYWAVRVMPEDNDARLEAAVEFAREQVVGRPDGDPDLKALAGRLLGEAGRLWAMSGRAATGITWTEDALVLADESGDPTARLFALTGQSIAMIFTGRAASDGVDVFGYFEEAADLAEETGQWWLLAMSASFAGAELLAFDPSVGKALLERGVAAASRSGNPYAIAAVAIAQGRAFSQQRDTDAAVAAFGVAIEGFGELGDERFALAARSDLAHALRRGGRLDEAFALYRQTVDGWIHLGHRGAVANQLENLAYAHTDHGDAERAVRLLGAAEAMREASGQARAFIEEPEQQAYVERLREALDATAFDSGWAGGRELTQADAVALAFAP
jgi:predicted ATPase/class 3 adenylate cyclase